MTTNNAYQQTHYPRIRRLMVDGGRLARQKHLVHGLFEMDVTEARAAMYAYRARTGEGLSFMAFVLACVGRAMQKHPAILAYRTWGGKQVLFTDVDVNTMFEVDVKGQKTIRPHIIRAVNRKSLPEIHADIQSFQANAEEGAEAKFIDQFVLLPGFLRRFILRQLFRNPRWLQQMYGTVALSSIGMFGQGGGWGIPVTNHTLQITLGGIAKRPVLVKGQLENHEFLCVTITVDHDLIDGAPAARFAHTLKQYIEGRAIWKELVDPGEPASL